LRCLFLAIDLDFSLDFVGLAFNNYAYLPEITPKNTPEGHWNGFSLTWSAQDRDGFLG
jgi:hypothetical protein